MADTSEAKVGCSAGCKREIRLSEVGQLGWECLPITGRWRCPQCWRETLARDIAKEQLGYYKEMMPAHTPLDAELPPLPEPFGLRSFPMFSADQMHAYARAAVAADRAARQPAPPVFGLVLGLADVDAAFEAEIHRVSHLEYASDDICRWFFSNVRNRLAALIQPQDDLARSSSEAPAAQAQQRSIDAADAARYRWLRNKQDEANGLDVAWWEAFCGESRRGEALDAAVDAEMAPQPPQGSSEGGA